MKSWTFGVVLGLIVSSTIGVIQSSYASAPKVQKWTVNLDGGSGNTEFLAVGRPSALKILGKGSAPKGSLALDGDKVSGSATFALNTLDTGISLRNEHMKKKYLEVEKFPEAKLTLTKLTLPAGKAAGDFLSEETPFEGQLLLHGVEKPVTGTARVERKGAIFSLDAKFGLSIEDYGIATPGFSGITMAKDVQVTVKSSGPLAQGT